MTKVTHFLKKPKFQTFRIRGKTITLLLNEKIFPPSVQGADIFSRNITVHPGESVIDVGTGSGILGILAAKLGGNVCATDSDKDSVLASQQNAKRNGVKIRAHKGNYFADFRGKFDVIIANLPTEIVHPTYLKAIGPKLAKTIDGGNNGNQWQSRFLKEAKKHMHSKSRAYITTNTLNDFYKSINEIITGYRARLLAFRIVNTKEFVQDNIKYYHNLDRKGKIVIFKQNNVWKEFAYLWELRLKNR